MICQAKAFLRAEGLEEVLRLASLVEWGRSPSAKPLLALVRGTLKSG